ncbi:MAG TPA: class I SAM-dependent methyltransferase [Acidimicrobiales bacterium]
MTQRDLWDYYECRVAQGVPGLANAVSYWQGLGVEVSEQEIASEAHDVERVLASLPPVSFLEVGAGPGTFTDLLPGWGVALDQSQSALLTIRRRCPTVPAVRADAMHLPVHDRSISRVFATHIYGLLEPDSRATLLNEAKRLSSELVILDAGRPEGVPAEHWQHRTLPDGSQWHIFRRHFDPQVLADEVGGEILFGGRFYVIVAEGFRSA